MIQCPLCWSAYKELGVIPTRCKCGIAGVLLDAAQHRATERLLQSIALSRRPSTLSSADSIKRTTAMSFCQSQSASDLPDGKYTAGTVFVGLQFGPGGEEPLVLAEIQSVCGQFGLHAEHVFVEDVNLRSAQTALKAIEDAEFLIFDFTGESANVFMELHYALGVGNRFEWIILTAKRGTELPFMVSHLAPFAVDDLLFWDKPEDLLQRLPDSIRAKKWRR